MNAIKLLVSGELIRQSLALPDDVEILEIQRKKGSVNNFEFILCGDRFPVVPESGEPMEGNAVVRADYTKRPPTWLTVELSWPK